MGKQMDRRGVLKTGALGGLGMLGLGKVSGAFDVSGAFAKFVEAAGTYDPMLVAAAKKDGTLNVITIPLKGWADYDEIMATYRTRWGIKINDAIPDGSSAQEIAAIKNLKGQTRAPDVVDVSPAWAQAGVTGGLFTPYKVATWSSIPSR